MTRTVLFDPLLPVGLLAVIGALAVLVFAIAMWRRQKGLWLRLPGLLLIGLALVNPSIQEESRTPLSDIVIAVVDESASQSVSDRAPQTAAALEALRAEVAAMGNTELRVVTVPDGDGNVGTELMSALSAALSEEPQGRIAGTVLLSDGRLHDLPRAPALTAPLHLLLSGQPTDWDRRLIIRNAPAFAILGEPLTLTLRIEDQGAAPEGQAVAPLVIRIDGGEPLFFEVPTGQDIELPLTLPHGGMNVLQFETPMAPEELTDRNNAAVVQINGIRDRLRVLLVSGEPHAGERTWRNLLKSDSSVDLVHFTILRPPEKQDGVPVDELSLIAFPTRELFLEKIHDFDLIIFDRYRKRGILPNAYIDNIAAYVEGGGAVLVAAGPEYGSADSIYRSSLSSILPGAPTARVIDGGYVPQLSDLGQRHPVTEGLTEFAPPAADGGDGPGWGRWLRLIDVVPTPDSLVLMTDEQERPLLMLERVGQGRVALLASDHAWLWDRGFEGGGPQLELLRRLAHWMMKEPELEEEALWAEAAGQDIRIIRRSMDESAPDVEVTGPDGTSRTITVAPTTAGRFEATIDGTEMGLYRLRSGDLSAVIAMGPAAPVEFENTIASGEALEPLIGSTNGGILPMSEGAPDVRHVREGRPAAGNGWIGITPRGAYQAADVRIFTLIPAWLLLLIGATLILGAWLREGRR